ncbi:MAG: DUF4386 domain-containing protein [Chloroflexota bacterium]
MMTKNERSTTIIVGVLFLIALVAAIVGGSLIDGILGESDYLSEVAANETQLLVGALLELINGVAVIGIAVLLFPILKRQDEGLALGYVALRIIEAIVIIAAFITPVALIALAQEYTAASAADASSLQAAGTSFLAVRERLVGQYTGIFFGLAAFLLYYLLYRSRLVPRLISVWGFIAVVLVVAWNLLKLFDIDIDAGMVFGLPIILNEMFLALWLIVKGFNTSAEVFEHVTPAMGRV